MSSLRRIYELKKEKARLENMVRKLERYKIDLASITCSLEVYPEEELELADSYVPKKKPPKPVPNTAPTAAPAPQPKKPPVKIEVNFDEDDDPPTAPQPTPAPEPKLIHRSKTITHFQLRQHIIAQGIEHNDPKLLLKWARETRQRAANGETFPFMKWPRLPDTPPGEPEITEYQVRKYYEDHYEEEDDEVAVLALKKAASADDLHPLWSYPRLPNEQMVLGPDTFA